MAGKTIVAPRNTHINPHGRFFVGMPCEVHRNRWLQHKRSEGLLVTLLPQSIYSRPCLLRHCVAIRPSGQGLLADSYSPSNSTSETKYSETRFRDESSPTTTGHGARSRGAVTVS